MVSVIARNGSGRCYVGGLVRSREDWPQSHLSVMQVSAAWDNQCWGKVVWMFNILR